MYDCDRLDRKRTIVVYPMVGDMCSHDSPEPGAFRMYQYTPADQSNWATGACLITTYDCDMTSITAPSLAILLTGGGTYSSRRDDGLCGCFTYGRAMVTDGIFYLGACLIIPMIVTTALIFTKGLRIVPV